MCKNIFYNKLIAIGLESALDAFSYILDGFQIVNQEMIFR